MGAQTLPGADMVKPKEEHHTYVVQLPFVLWHKLCAEADETGRPIIKILTEMLQQRYKVKDADLPAPKRVGRRPKKSQ